MGSQTLSSSPVARVANLKLTDSGRKLLSDYFKALYPASYVDSLLGTAEQKVQQSEGRRVMDELFDEVDRCTDDCMRRLGA